MWPMLLKLINFGFFALCLFYGCGILRTQVTTYDNHVQMPSYSFPMPEEKGWQLQRDDSRDYASLTKRIDPIIWQIRTYKNPVRSDVLVAATAKQIADDFRKLGVVSMTEEGVNKGLYELKNIEMGEEIIGVRRFYTMEHEISSPSLVQKVSTYLYFPQPANNRYFYVAHYFEQAPPNVKVKSYKQDFLNMLTRLEFK